MFNFKKNKEKQYQHLVLFFTVVFVIISLLMCSRIWLHRYYILTFNVNTEQNINITLKVNDTHNDLKDITYTIEPTSKTAKIKIPAKKIASLSITFDRITENTTISDIQIKGKKKYNFNLNDFHYNKTLKIQDNNLIAESYKQNVCLKYDTPIEKNGMYVFDGCYFIIVLILSSLLFFKIFSYIFMLEKKEDTYFNCLFIFILLIIVTLPTLFISNDTISEVENRPLAKKPEIKEILGEKNTFSTDFEKWFNDHFYGRYGYMNMYNWIKYINKYQKKNTLLEGKDNWYYGEIKNVTKFNEKELTPYVKNLEFLNNFCNENNIKCYIEIVPEKPNFIEPYLLRKYNPKLKQHVIFLKENIPENIDIKIIYPDNELFEADKKDYIYYKTDHHWTEWGAYTGYKALMKEIKKDFPDIFTVDETYFTKFKSKKVRAEYNRKFTNGSSCLYLGHNAKCILKTEYTNYKPIHSYITEKRKKDAIKNFYNKKGKYNCVIISNSFAENFVTFLPYSFKYTNKYRTNTKEENSMRLSRWTDDIKKTKPDVLVILFNELGLNQLLSLED